MVKKKKKNQSTKVSGADFSTFTLMLRKKKQIKQKKKSLDSFIQNDEKQGLKDYLKKKKIKMGATDQLISLL